MRSRPNRLISAILAAPLAVLLTVVTPNAYAVEPKIEQCLDPTICPIPYVRLAKQETEPFLFIGKVVDDKHPKFGEYISATRRFPDARSCLKQVEREDLRRIDWKAIDNIREIEVCVFRIASSIEDVEVIKHWLMYHGFTVKDLKRTHRETYTPKFDTDPIFQLRPRLAIEKFRKIVQRTWLTRIIGLELGREYYLFIDFSQSGRVAGVSSWLASKWNT